MTMTDEREGIADYKFIRQLGAGSHGVFYLAYPPKRLPVAAEFVAVKVLSGGSSQDSTTSVPRTISTMSFSWPVAMSIDLAMKSGTSAAISRRVVHE